VNVSFPEEYPFDTVVYSYAESYGLFEVQHKSKLEYGKSEIVLPSNITDAVMVRISYQKRSVQKLQEHLVLFMLPNDSVSLVFTYQGKGPDLKMEIYGANAAGHQEFLDFKDHFPKYTDYMNWFYDINPDVEGVADTVIRKIESIVKPYNDLLNLGRIDSSYANIVANHLKSTLCSRLLSDVFNVRWGRFGSGFDQEKRLRTGKKINCYCDLAEEHALVNTSFALFRSAKLKYKRMITNNKKEYAQLPDTIVNEGYKALHISKKHAHLLLEPDDELREFLIAYQLYFEFSSLIGNEFDRDRKALFQLFKREYPGSKYLNVIHDERFRNTQKLIEAANTSSTQPYPDEYYAKWAPIIIDDSGSITDFSFSKEGVNLREGKYFIDVWATWCLSCLEDFSSNASTDSMLSSMGYDRLYISVDSPDRKYNEWVSIIDKYHLGGYHILAGEELKALLFKNQYSKKVSKIPRYLILINGTIVDYNAPSPRNRLQLYDALKSEYKLESE
jgi:thiol-disulfide isomerase/thioredoxin